MIAEVKSDLISTTIIAWLPLRITISHSEVDEWTGDEC
jgi:hypothetical protein